MNEHVSIDTVPFLERAASAWRGEDECDPYLPGLMAVCRKIDVGRRLFASYPPDWSNPANERLLDCDEWLRVMTALLACVEHETRLGYRLKLLNSLLKSIDIVRSRPARPTDSEERIQRLEGKIHQLVEERQ